MTEVKFHTKPTQINREDPIKIIDNGFYTAWAYPLSNGYCIGFKVFDNYMSEAALIKLEAPDKIHWYYPTTVDIHTRQDLVDFVKTWNDMRANDIVEIIKQIQRKHLEPSQSLHAL
jgi:hypothetical protein|nr:MAG TPA: hypothetical protein [Caudoviricetes sp.]